MPDNLMAKFRISGVPITEGRKLVGIITNRDLKFETDFSQKDQGVHDIRRARLQRKKELLWMRQRRFLLKLVKEKLPIVDDEV